LKSSTIYLLLAAKFLPADLFNEVLWQGMMGNQPYPAVRTGIVMGQRSVK